MDTFFSKEEITKKTSQTIEKDPKSIEEALGNIEDKKTSWP